MSEVASAREAAADARKWAEEVRRPERTALAQMARERLLSLSRSLLDAADALEAAERCAKHWEQTAAALNRYVEKVEAELRARAEEAEQRVKELEARIPWRRG